MSRPYEGAPPRARPRFVLDQRRLLSEFVSDHGSSVGLGAFDERRLSSALLGACVYAIARAEAMHEPAGFELALYEVSAPVDRIVIAVHEDETIRRQNQARRIATGLPALRQVADFAVEARELIGDWHPDRDRPQSVVVALAAICERANRLLDSLAALRAGEGELLERAARPVRRERAMQGTAPTTERLSADELLAAEGREVATVWRLLIDALQTGGASEPAWQERYLVAREDRPLLARQLQALRETLTAQGAPASQLPAPRAGFDRELDSWPWPDPGSERVSDTHQPPSAGA